MRILGLWMALAVAGGALCQGGVTPGVLAAGKRATAYLDRGRTSATAFCVEKSGYYATNAHAVVGAKSVRLVVNAGEVGETAVMARVVRVNEDDDLALLKTDDDGPYATLTLGNSDMLTETMAVTAFGYPFGEGLAMGEEKYPNISVNSGRITALRKEAGKLQIVQLDAVLNPGNSGGPVVDSRGYVIGIVMAGIRGAGINFAVPVNLLTDMLSRPEVAYTEQTIPLEGRFRSTEVGFSLVTFGRPTGALTAEFAVMLTETTGRAYTAEAGAGGTYKARVTAMLPPKAGERTVEAWARAGGREEKCTLRDGSVTIAGAAVSLSRLATIETGAGGRARALTGQTATGAIGGLNALQDAEGKRVDLSWATTIDILDALTAPTRLACAIAVKRGDEQVAFKRVTLVLTGLPGAPPAAADDAFKGRDLLTMPVPGEVSDAAIGGAGKYVVFMVKNAKRVGLFDTGEMKVVRSIPTQGEDVMLAADDTSLYVAQNDAHVIEKWNLGAARKDGEMAIPAGERLSFLAAGWLSGGPIMMGVVPTDKRKGRTALLDAGRMSESAIGPTRGWLAADDVEEARVRAAGNGSCFTAWRVGTIPSGVYVMSVDRGAASATYEHQSRAPLLPGVDGSVLYTAHGRYAAGTPKSPVEKDLAEMQCVPAAGGGLFLAMRGNKGKVYSECDGKELFALPELTEMPGIEDDEYRTDGMTLEKRLMYFPEASLLLTLSKDRKQYYLRKLNPATEMWKAGARYLYVASSPPAAEAGKAWTYQIDARSWRGVARCTMVTGPAGMTVTPEGRVEWPAAATHAGDPVAVAVKVSDGAGQETTYTFTVRRGGA